MRLLLICGLTLALAPLASAGNTQPVNFILRDAQISSTVSQQAGVTNPDHNCGWDAADYEERDIGINASLAAGAIATDSFCFFQDWSPRVIITDIAANSSALTMTISLSTGGSYFVSPTFDKRLGLWVYETCVALPTYQPGDPALQVIDGSNGGGAVPTTVTLAITNPARKAVSTLRYYWEFTPGTC